MDIVRVFRMIEYVGPRDQVEEQISHSVHGSRRGIKDVVITATTLGTFAEVVQRGEALPTATLHCGEPEPEPDVEVKGE